MRLSVSPVATRSVARATATRQPASNEAMHAAVVNPRGQQVRPRALQLLPVGQDVPPPASLFDQPMGWTTDTGSRAPAPSEPATSGVVIQRGRSTDRKIQQLKKKKAASRKKDPAFVTALKSKVGTHGSKKREQQRLSKLHKIKVSGDTHQSEHTVGFEPLNRTSNLKRGSKGRARKLENEAPAYQEELERHRQHIGTGSRGTADASGFNAESYREAQRALIEKGDVSSAVQLNQLGYAFDPKFQQNRNTATAKASDDSFNEMVTNMSELTYAQGDEDVPVSVGPTQQAEMHLSRLAATSGQYPDLKTQNAVRKLYDLPEIED